MLVLEKSVFFTIAGVAALGYYLLLLLIAGVLEWRAHDWNWTRNVRKLLGLGLTLVLIAAAALTYRGVCHEDLQSACPVICNKCGDPGIDNAKNIGITLHALWALSAGSMGVGYLKARYSDRIHPWLLPGLGATLSAGAIFGCTFIDGTQPVNIPGPETVKHRGSRSHAKSSTTQASEVCPPSLSLRFSPWWRF